MARAPEFPGMFWKALLPTEEKMYARRTPAGGLSIMKTCIGATTYSTVRRGLLHAINCEREKLAAVIMMWAPAHRGGSVSAYADAAAKAGTAAVRDGDAHLQQVQQWLPSDRCAIVVREPEGWSLWPTNRHTAYRDAIGWWVLRRMTRGGCRVMPTHSGIALHASGHSACFT